MSNIEQKLPCEVVQDILPLYHDGGKPSAGMPYV